ncbi:MAG TPA: hypothetical protein VF572_05095 [Candidatus Saccharimonadales bacterium]|jgi:excinuclease UvrABC nuclease subunit
MLTTQTYLGQHSHYGPFTDVNSLPDASGVYVITTQAVNGQHTIIDVGESHNIRERITNHDRAQQWLRHQINGVYAWTLQCDERSRMLIETALRSTYRPVCGIR